MRTLWRFILFLTLFVLLVGILLPFSEGGSRALLELVGRYSPLQITYESGTLAGQLRLSRVALHQDTLSLEVSDIQAELAPACLWRSVFCFEQLRLGQLSIDVVPTATPAETVKEGSGEHALYRFPVQLETDELFIGATRIRWQGGEWRQGEARLQVRLRDSSINILQAVLSRPLLQLADVDTIPAASDERLELASINLPLSLSVDAVLLEQPAWDIYGNGHQLQTLSLSGHWMRDQLYIARLAGADESYGDFQLEGELSFDGDWPLVVGGAFNSEQPPLWQPLQERRFQFAASGSLASLALQLDSPGTPLLAVEAQLDVLDRQLPFESSIELSWPQDQRLGELQGVPPVLAEVVLDGPLKAVVSGRLEQQHFELQGSASGLGYQGLQANVSGRHRQGRLEISALQLHDQSGTSELRGEGVIELADSLRASLQLSTGGLELPELSEYAFGRVHGKLKIDLAMGAEEWQLRLEEIDLSGYINELPAQVQGHFGLADGLLLARSDLQAELNGARLLLQSSGDSGRPGLIELEVNDLGRWQPGSRGRLELQGELFTGEGQLALSGTVEDLEWQGIQVKAGEFSGSYRGNEERPFTLDTSLTELELADVQLDSLQLRADGTAASHSISLATVGDVQGELSLAGSYRSDKWRAELARTVVHTSRGDWRLDQPVALAWSVSSSALSLSAHCWRLASTRVCPGDMSLGSDARGSLAVDGDMSFLAAFMPDGMEVNGQLQLRLDGSWNEADGLRLNGTSETRSVRLQRHYGDGESASLGWDGGSGSIDYSRAGLKLDWRIRREARELLSLALLLPPERDAPISGKVVLSQFQLSALSAFAPMLSGLQGALDGDLQLSGVIDQPRANGQLSLSDGKLALVGNPTQLEQLELTLDVQGERAKIQGRGLLGGGELRLSGLLESRPEWQLELNVKGDRQQVLYPPSTELLLSQDLQVVVSESLLQVNGEMTVHQGRLEPEQLPEGSVAVSADVVEVDYAGNVIREDLPFDLGLDLRIRVEDKFRVVGGLIDTTLGGNLHALQRPQRPLQLFGSLRTVGGQVRAYQQSLQIKRGSLTFTGRADNPAVDVRAQRNISGSNIVVGVQLLGTLDEMLLEVYSDPAMSQGEAMSYLVRGRGLDASTGEDGTALALSLASGVVNRTTLVSELNRIPGISNVAFGSEGSADDTAATVGGYIGNRVYLSYGVGLYEPINVLTARLYLRNRLWLEVVSRLENSIDLYYGFDID